MKKILYVLPSLEPGGAEKSVILTANYLVAQYGYHISIFTFMKAEGLRGLLHPSVRIVGGQLFDQRTKSNSIYSSYVKIPIALWRHFRNVQYDIIISGFELGPEIPLLIARFMALVSFSSRRSSFVSVIQNSLRHVARNSHRNVLVMKAAAFLRPILFDVVIAVSDSVRAQIAGNRHGKCVVINNPVERGAVIERASGPLPESLRTFAANGFYISVSRISRQKNLLMLLRAFNAVKEIITENLFIVGSITDHEYRMELEQFILTNDLTQRVLITGAMENHFPLVAASKGFLFTSDYEGFPLAIIESLVLKKVIVSTMFEGYRDILSPRISILVQSEKELSEKLVNIRTGKEETESLVRLGAESVSRYEISVIGKEYYELFERITS